MSIFGVEYQFTIAFKGERQPWYHTTSTKGRGSGRIGGRQQGTFRVIGSYSNTKYLPNINTINLSFFDFHLQLIINRHFREANSEIQEIAK